MNTQGWIEDHPPPLKNGKGHAITKFSAPRPPPKSATDSLVPRDAESGRATNQTNGRLHPLKGPPGKHLDEICACVETHADLLLPVGDRRSASLVSMPSTRRAGITTKPAAYDWFQSVHALRVTVFWELLKHGYSYTHCNVYIIFLHDQCWFHFFCFLYC